MIEHLTLETFKTKVFNFETNTEWKFEGDKPCVADFFASWCGPCKMIAPILEELATEYEGKIDFYKVDTEAEQELAQIFGIRSIPSLLFIPIGKDPEMLSGAMSKQQFKDVFKDLLAIN